MHAALPLAWAMTSHAAEQAAATEPTQAEIARQMCEHTVCQRTLHVLLKQRTANHRTLGVFPGIVRGIGIIVVAGQTVHVVSPATAWSS